MKNKILKGEVCLVCILEMSLNKKELTTTMLQNAIDILQHVHAIALQEQQKMDQDREAYDSKIHALIAENRELVLNAKSLQTCLERVEIHNKELMNQVRQANEEVEALRKVSHIIAIEKENAKLRRELEDLKKRDTHASTQSSTQESVVCDVNAIEDHEIEVYEKRFNKKSYYVSDDDKMIIYNILEDGAVGEEIGHCVKDASGRLKPVWK